MRTLAELLDRLGGVPPSRVLAYPPHMRAVRAAGDAASSVSTSTPCGTS